MKLPRTSQALTEIIARIRAGVRGRGDFTPGLDRDVSLSYDVGSASRIGYRSSQDRAWGCDWNIAASPGNTGAVALTTLGGVNFRVLGALFRNATAGNLTVNVSALGRDDAKPAFAAAPGSSARYTENSLSQNEFAPTLWATKNGDALQFGIPIYRFVLPANNSFLLPMDFASLPSGMLLFQMENVNTALQFSVWGETY